MTSTDSHSFRVLSIGTHFVNGSLDDGKHVIPASMPLGKSILPFKRLSIGGTYTCTVVWEHDGRKPMITLSGFQIFIGKSTITTSTGKFANFTNELGVSVSCPLGVVTKLGVTLEEGNQYIVSLENNQKIVKVVSMI